MGAGKRYPSHGIDAESRRRFRILLPLLAFSIITIGGYATSVNVIKPTTQTKRGYLTYIYFETISGPGSAPQARTPPRLRHLAAAPT